ncbi:sensor histidine kinase [Paenibacillus barcinonensis]|uniref:histidine kinase n=1 Tax=Paenibacillus barcinonensis TaxID=198119 RepID=A0A2V4VLY5_PAEBA|nr:sensor histidine kinase [Paenibacillus barcinonensis]PYE50606.1 signal transduction histidine kinase [Paenibacillus barcinonensis]QKS57302.1 sensor histidine kinase [Paenibacillus barcinonensis]
MPLRFLQYGLLLVPTVLYSLMLPAESEALYTFYILIAVGLAVAHRFTRSGAPQALLFLAEIVWSSHLIASYGPFMLSTGLSALYVYMYRLNGSMRWTMLAIQITAINLTLCEHYSSLPWLMWNTAELQAMDWSSESTQVIIAMNLLLFMTAALAWQGAKTATSRGQLEHVYDELRNKHYELQEARAQLLLFSKQLEDAAQIEERTRISRQLHDDIGHRLIRTKMMSEAALLTLPLHPEQGLVIVEQIRDQLTASMEDMRNTLLKLKPDPQPSDAYALDRLLEEVGRDTGIITNYAIRGQAYPLYPSTQIVLYKNAREAITNALRHGKANEIKLELVFEQQEVTMMISNDGSTLSLLHAEGSTSTGLGLESMRQRTQYLGGTVEIQANYPYTVITRIPISNKMNLL